MTVSVLDLLRPVPCPYPLVRIGGDADGAYLIPDDLEGITNCFSPGVNNYKSFEDELSLRYGIKCHMCDFTSDVERLKTPLVPQLQTFDKKWLDVDGDADSLRLDQWIEMYCPAPMAGDLMLQIDIEGAEYRNLLDAGAVVLGRFRIIVIELHALISLNSLDSEGTEVARLLHCLSQTHLCVHAHPNNCGGVGFVDESTGMDIPNVIELTLLRRDRFIGAPSEWIPPQLPHVLDICSNSQRLLPVHLNERWLDQGRSLESEIKVLGDHLRYAEEEIRDGLNYKRAYAFGLAGTANLFSIAQRALGAVQSSAPIADLAAGKPYVLSSSLGGPLTGLVQGRKPYFFHTQITSEPSITIDLGVPSCLLSLEVVNRTDLCQERALALHFVVHQDPRFCIDQALPLCIDAAFLGSGGGESITPLLALKGQFITILSPCTTALHLASIVVMGFPLV